MKSLTFQTDLLGLADFAARLEKFIATEHQFVQGGLVVALSSPFGFGKTTFLEMWLADMESRNDDEQNDHFLVIPLNAWESDYFGDPLFAIISSLLSTLSANSSSADAIKRAAKTLGWFSLAITNQVVNAFTGIDVDAAGETTAKKIRPENATTLPQDAFSIYQGRKNAMINLKTTIKEFVTNSDDRVIFLVDELDRCRPDYAIEYLETIKHIFDIVGVTFIIAADRKQLENSAKSAFGNELDFDEYYRKFIHREVSLPPITGNGYKKLVSEYTSDYLEKLGVRNCIIELEQANTPYLVELTMAFKPTPRQMQEVFRTLGHLLADTKQHGRKLQWCGAVASLAMAVFKVNCPKMYRLLGLQQYDPADAIQDLRALVGPESSDWWFGIFLTGGGFKMDHSDSESSILARHTNCEHDLDQFRLGWKNFGSSKIARIHKMIDEISQWD